MRPNKVKRTLQQGGVAVGTMVFEFNTTGIARIAAEAGAEFVIFDMEHTGWSMETVRTLIATANGVDIVPMVRIPTTQYHFIARALDVGAMGLMIPMVETEQQARLIAQFAKYPPTGRRGAAFGVAHDNFTDGDIIGKMQSANEETLLIAQIETAQGVQNVEAIAAVDGIDVLWIGHFDLTNSMGIPGQFTHPDFVLAITRVLAACEKHGKTAGFMCANVDEGKALMQQGFRALSYWGDIWLYKRALREGIDGLRSTSEA